MTAPPRRARRPRPGAARAGAEAHGEAGFTLVELLVSLALLSLVTAGIATSLSFGRRAWQRAETVEARGRDGAALRALRSLLESAERAPSASGGAAEAPLVGDAADVMFYVERPDPARPGSALARARLWFAPPAAGMPGRLMLALGPAGFDPGGASAPAGDGEVRVLLGAVDAAAFAYLGRREGEVLAAWGPAWGERTHLPSLVSLSLARAGGGGRETVLHVRPRTAD